MLGSWAFWIPWQSLRSFKMEARSCPSSLRACQWFSFTGKAHSLIVSAGSYMICPQPCNSDCISSSSSPCLFYPSHSGLFAGPAHLRQGSCSRACVLAAPSTWSAFCWVASWLAPSPPSDLCSNATLLVRPFLPRPILKKILLLFFFVPLIIWQTTWFIYLLITALSLYSNINTSKWGIFSSHFLLYF